MMLQRSMCVLWRKVGVDKQLLQLYITICVGSTCFADALVYSKPFVRRKCCGSNAGKPQLYQSYILKSALTHDKEVLIPWLGVLEKFLSVEDGPNIPDRRALTLVCALRSRAKKTS